jgi:hypothetical protein
MPYDLPTAAQFKAKFLTFAAIGDPTLDMAITEASASVDRSWIEADYQPAIMYLAAHIMTIDGVLSATVDLENVSSVINSGIVTKMKVGDVDVTLAGAASGTAGAGAATGLRSTGYGLRYLELLRRNQPAVALV